MRFDAIHAIEKRVFFFSAIKHFTTANGRQ